MYILKSEIIYFIFESLLLISDFVYKISYISYLLIFFRFPSVCIFSTGDELVSDYGTYHDRTQDTNSLMIEQILDQDNYEGFVINSGIVKDKYVIFKLQSTSIFNGVDNFIDVFMHIRQCLVILKFLIRIDIL